jgi:cellulose synthase/poly-beta-1,6-N-acetylglucosamine synthase-like glycosyltransferase
MKLSILIPCYNEVNTILEIIKKIENNYKDESEIIIIDDFRLFGLCEKNGMNEDWSKINKENLLDILKSRISKVYHLDSDISKDDRMIIHINAK